MSAGTLILLSVVGVVAFQLIKRMRRPDPTATGRAEAPDEPAGIKPSFTHTWDIGGRTWNNPVASMSRESGMFPTTAGGLETLLELESWINSKDPRAVEQIHACLMGDDPGVCHYVAMWCASLGLAECEPALVRILRQPERVWGYARKQSALTLAELLTTA